MVTITIVDKGAPPRSIEATEGLSLMEVLRDENIEEIQALCGGCCSCATCHVHIPQNQSVSVNEMEDDEAMLVELADGYDAEKSRLSCQIPITASLQGLEVHIVSAD